MEYTSWHSSTWHTAFAHSSEMLHTDTLTGLSSRSTYFFRIHSGASESALLSFATTGYPGDGWPVGGDANFDCIVNALDLLFIRNRLGRDVSLDDNWQADITTDGVIDVLDLLIMRALYGSTCSD